jgi:Domain of unknown function (DUF4062)
MIRAFVSSTYNDLKDHRAYVIDRLQRGGIAVDPMEKWTAASDEPKELSQERVNECDVCILLVGFRRGHIPEGEHLSITQLEYLEAIRREKEVLVFMADEHANWPAEAIAEMARDPDVRRWRNELKEHMVTGFFTPQPESIDVTSALLRFYEKRASTGKEQDTTTQAGGSAIEIRAYSSSGAALIVWRSEQPIAGCLGFALHKRILGQAAFTEEVVETRLGFALDNPGSRFNGKSSTLQPIQRFRWIDSLEEGQEARYRVVPVFGTPQMLKEADPDMGSGWTPWISRKSAQTPGFRAFANRGLASMTFASILTQQKAVHRKAIAGPINEYLGGELRRMLLASLAGAKQRNGRVFAVLSDVDDPQVIHALKCLGNKLYLVLGKGAREEGKNRASQTESIRRGLIRGFAHVYPQVSSSTSPSHGNNFAVFCDEWGAPGQVWTGSAAWTSRALATQENNALLIESVPLARAFLDRWEILRDGTRSLVSGPASSLRPIQVTVGRAGVTLWNSPAKGDPELRDIIRLIRGARQGILFLLRNEATPVLREILQLGGDLLLQGITSPLRGDSITIYDSGFKTLVSRKGRFSSALKIGSTVIVIDPFGPHPVVIIGSHEFATRASTANHADLLIIEDAPGLAADFAVHIMRILDHNRFRTFLSRSTTPTNLGLKPNDSWQQVYFKDTKRTAFDFLFGLLGAGG